MVRSHLKGVPLLAPNHSQSKYLQGVVLLAFLLLGGASLLNVGSRFLMSRHAASEARTPPPDGIKVRVTPATFGVEARQQFRLKAITDFDTTCERIDAKIPDQQWEQSFTRAELLNGSQGQWNPRQTGSFRMQFFCAGRYLGDTGLSVIVPPNRAKTRDPRIARKFRWVLSSGTPIYRDTSFFEIPISARSEEQRGSTFAPSVVGRDTFFKVVDGKGQLSKIEPIVIQKNTAISDPIYLPFPIGADYRFIAYEKEHGQSSNELGVSWSQLNPKLTLVAFPGSVSMYSAAISSAKVQLFLALDGRQIKPSENMKVLFEAPPVFQSAPQGGVPLTPAEPIGDYSLSAATSAGGWKVNFQAPRIGAMTSANIQVLSTKAFSVTACLAGLIGVFVARRRRLFEQAWWLVVIELLCAAAAAFLLHGLILAGWIKVPGTAEFMLGYFAAILAGLIGGYMGLGVFHLAKSLIGKLFS